MIQMMRSLVRFLSIILICLTCAAAPRRTRNVILVTADGLRWQDFFGGMDPMLKDEKSAGMDQAKELKAKLWRPEPDERRRALMPFFWTSLAAQGVVLGNVQKGSSVRVTNAFRVRIPGTPRFSRAGRKTRPSAATTPSATPRRQCSNSCGAS